ncbi:type VI secretion system lipoprotein TssJ [Pseudoalteromonas denitrificans]|uniref:Type VI secretion system protein VasD n=1 Tax=Pseudoalteromonas denitrificans DSM 6059 TaxID=1123010 RepID=A0A1I1NDL6_9GAMM|nr:type VI secretion system lipoprotein TssJ [Pseudoalteromonas denitrificans]SFC95575.1 type VI secretion system protein VasD [Pseudoalteromonas denitrificans DSM 6059]
MLNLSKKIVLIGFGFLLFGCMTTKVNLKVEATDNLNLNQFEEALPVVLKIYQLSDIQAFKNASFEQLWKSDKSVLANSLLTVEERTVNPSEKLNIEFEQDENARFVALVALFRDRSDNKWRTFHDLNSGSVKLSTSLEVLISSNSVQLPGVEVTQ